jgi:tetratricopeptide (TPR) repeat protein
MIRMILLATVCVLLVTSLTAAGEPSPPPSDGDALAPLIEGLGTLDHRVTTSKPMAQQYFNQGLRLIFAFNHDEAIRAFRAVSKIDPNCAMAYWGIALALGPNYNVAAEKERSAAAHLALSQAQRLAAGASPREAAYIEALSHRYVESPDADRKPLDTAYANAMRQFVARFPDDLDGAVLFAESMMDLHPWDLWAADGTPQPGTEEIVGTLEGVLKRDPNHPGAIHFYIHAVEASRHPEKALEYALRLGDLMPGAGHLVHMPSHTYIRVGRYHDAAEANRRAVEVDRKYIEKYKPEGIYQMMYYPHNIHFLWYALSMERRGDEAIAAATQVVEMLGEDMVREMPMLEAFMPTRLFALVRFERWEDIMREKRPSEEFTYADGMWHYAQGMARLATAQVYVARDHKTQMDEILAVMPEDKKAMRHSAATLLKVASLDLGAAIEARAKHFDVAVAALNQAIDLQDHLQYDEPPPWYIPQRQTLGAVWLAADRPADAEAAYREDLARNPENGWSLRGLEHSLQVQNRAAEAELVHRRLEKAWPTAAGRPASEKLPSR